MGEVGSKSVDGTRRGGEGGEEETNPISQTSRPASLEDASHTYHSNTLPATPARVFNVSWHDPDGGDCGGGGGEGDIGDADDDADVPVT